MVAQGIRLDPAVCEADSERLRALREPYEEAATSWAGQDVNWASPKQVAAFLYDECGFAIPPVQGTLKAVKLVREGERPTSEASLLHLAQHASDTDRAGLEAVLAFRKLGKEAQFARDLPKYVGSDGRIHPSLASTTATGRLSCSKPNLQQIPAGGDILRGLLNLPDPQIRKAFIASPGNVLVVLDFSALEWRVLGHFLAELLQDWSIVEETRSGADPHGITGERMDVPRNIGKLLNYSTIYLKSAAGLGAQIKDANGKYIGTTKAKKYLERFNAARPGIAAFQDLQIQHWRDHGHVRTLLGRRRWIDTAHWGNRRKAANTPIQGSAHDIMTAALFAVSKLRTPVLQIHDELVFDVPIPEAENLKETLTTTMETAITRWATFHCPLTVEGGIGENWQEAK